MKENKKSIVPGIYVSVWDGGTEVPSPCLINLNTKEVFSIATIPGTGELEVLENEYLLIKGEKFSIAHKTEARKKDYWYV